MFQRQAVAASFVFARMFRWMIDKRTQRSSAQLACNLSAGIWICRKANKRSFFFAFFVSRLALCSCFCSRLVSCSRIWFISLLAELRRNAKWASLQSKIGDVNNRQATSQTFARGFVGASSFCCHWNHEKRLYLDCTFLYRFWQLRNNSQLGFSYALLCFCDWAKLVRHSTRKPYWLRNQCFICICRLVLFRLAFCLKKL